IYCLVYRAVIAPTDPIAVLAILKQVGAPKSIEMKPAGERLFNDGVSVVEFIGLLRLAGHRDSSASLHHDGTGTIAAHVVEIAKLFLVEVGGGLAAGFALGLVLFALLRSIEDYRTEVFLTLAGVTGLYALCTHWHLSGPLAAVVAGLFIGNS